MPSPEISIGAGRAEYIGNTRVSVVPKFEHPRSSHKPASSVATHEAEHAVVAIANGTPVESVTVIPGPGYNGLTKLSRPDPIAAVAPHANGRDGTNHDVFITQLGGHNVEALSGIARNITDKKRPHIDEVARTLDAKGTLSGRDIKKVMRKVDKEKSEPIKKKADVFISRPDGTNKEISDIPYSGGIVIFPGEWVPVTGKKPVAI